MNLYKQLKYQTNIVPNVILDLGANAGIEGEKIYNIWPTATLIFVEPCSPTRIFYMRKLNPVAWMDGGLLKTVLSI